MEQTKEIQPIAAEVLNGANVEKTLAKYFGLSVTKLEVQSIKKALQKRDKIKIAHSIEDLLHKRWKFSQQ
ncbi:hypothetical protein BLX88_06010 [Bacillus obstructivus]|uniref:hypothetical protein n=1 Tax=Heyndrickxia TaxID=2837504 RepID=UPI000904270A|nr:hypothetical protein [Heyndrickxia oleronia]OJH19820.1 hypothetical protein BLX88_06010 [Bacillus obstructivus]GIN41688.1 hypothetical protein J19TS1_46370 [Heyndrickxia oleronia]